jgi:hypothetical protein
MIPKGKRGRPGPNETDKLIQNQRAPGLHSQPPCLNLKQKHPNGPIGSLPYGRVGVYPLPHQIGHPVDLRERACFSVMTDDEAPPADPR